MKINWNVLVFQGQSYLYDYKDSWGKRYYSFDREQTWFTSKKAAFESAQASGSLRHPLNQPRSEFHIA